MRRVVLLGTAVGFFAWENATMISWLRTHASLRGALAVAWATLNHDPLVRLVMVDMGIFTIIALSWLWLDLAARALPRIQRFTWFSATLVFGCPAFLTYLAVRPARSTRPDDVPSHSAPLVAN